MTRRNLLLLGQGLALAAVSSTAALADLSSDLKAGSEMKVRAVSFLEIAGDKITRLITVE